MKLGQQVNCCPNFVMRGQVYFVMIRQHEYSAPVLHFINDPSDCLPACNSDQYTAASNSHAAAHVDPQPKPHPGSAHGYADLARRAAYLHGAV